MARSSIDPDREILERLWRIRDDVNDLERIILARNGGSAEPENPHNKDGDGRLTARGIAALEGLFEKNLNRNQAAAAMGISYRAAHLRWIAWKNREKKAARDDA